MTGRSAGPGRARVSPGASPGAKISGPNIVMVAGNGDPANRARPASPVLTDSALLLLELDFALPGLPPGRRRFGQSGYRAPRTDPFVTERDRRRTRWTSTGLFASGVTTRICPGRWSRSRISLRREPGWSCGMIAIAQVEISSPPAGVTAEARLVDIQWSSALWQPVSDGPKTRPYSGA